MFQLTIFFLLREKEGKTFSREILVTVKRDYDLEPLFLPFQLFLSFIGKFKKWMYSGVFNMMNWNEMQNQLFS